MKNRWKRSLFLLIFLLFSFTGLYAADGTPIDTGATAWMLTSTALVLLMIPGLAMFYGGLVRSKNVLGTIMHSYVAMNDEASIPTPKDEHDYKASKMPEGMTIEQLQQQRDQDFSNLTRNQKRA